MTQKKLWLSGFGLSIIGLLLFGYMSFSGAPKATGDEYWNSSVESSKNQFDHSLWQEILEEYVITGEASNINTVDYEGIQENDQDSLASYINYLTAIDPRNYNRAEQQAYWINLYNALTVQLISQNYPLESITTLGQTTLAFGPWDDQLTTVAGKGLSLNDIEHRILRPFWNDHRIHFAVNCASIGCPNLQAQAFTAENTEALLEQGAYEYLNHPRGLSFDNDSLTLSSIFEWYAEDFGQNPSQVLSTLSGYVNDEIAEKLNTYNGDIKYEYSWQLNGS